MDRRRFLQTGMIATGMAAVPAWGRPDSPRTRLIASITRDVLKDNLDGRSVSWFHPRACMVPRPGDSPLALMTLQSISGSDYFGPVHWMSSNDLGKHWTEPVPIPSLGRQPVPRHEGLQAGVCDVVPEYHPPTKTVLAMGHVVFYRGKKFSPGDQLARYPVYAVRQPDGHWSDSKKLVWDDPRGRFIYSNNCGQRVVLPNGEILLAFTFGPQPRHRSVAGVRCRFDGQELTVLEVGPALEHPVKRGLLEPSMTSYKERFFLTIRAEDQHGYVSVSEDGLHWKEKQPWCWDDGTPVFMSTTQQHWLTHSDGLFLVYTRKDASNVNVIRWRAPLFVARVDPDRLVLIRETEQIVHPLQGDGVKGADHVPLMGNFHVTNASPEQSWVTVGSWLPRQQARGQLLLARIHWSQPNQLVTQDASRGV